MTADDLPTTDGYRWQLWAGDWYAVPSSGPTKGVIFHSACTLVKGRIIPIPVRPQPDLSTPAEVRAYYTARPHVPCPFRFEL